MQNKKTNTKQKQKGGVSLIVLVITIIVMVILAAAVVVTLNNTGILDKANTAVYNTNKAEVHTVVQILALNGNGTIDGAKLQEEVAKMGGTCVPNSIGGWNVKVKNYSCSVMPNGSIGEFSSVTAQKNEYGFYENQAYVGSYGNVIVKLTVNSDNSIYIYAVMDGEEVLQSPILPQYISYSYELAQVNLKRGVIAKYNVSDGGNIIHMTYEIDEDVKASASGEALEELESMEAFDLEFNCMFGLYKEAYYGQKYIIDEELGGGYVILNRDGSNEVYAFGEFIDDAVVTYVNEHFILVESEFLGDEPLEIYLSIDGKTAYVGVSPGTYGVFAVLEEGGSGGITNPYENLEWEMAWTCTNKVWSDTIVKGETIPTGVDITAKLYKNGRTVEADEEAMMPHPAGDAYTLVLEGSGEMGDIATNILEESTYSAWIKEKINNVLLSCYITECIIGSGITSISNTAFAATQIVNITIPSSVTKIDDYAFDACEKLTSVTIPSSVTSVGIDAFSLCIGLTSVNIQNSVIGNGMFSSCSSLTNVTLSNNVTSIGESAFSECENLTSITIPSSVISIEDYAFYNCTNLATVNIYSTSSSFTVKNYAFYNIANPSTIYIVPGHGIASKFIDSVYDSSITTISETLTVN